MTKVKTTTLLYYYDDKCSNRREHGSKISEHVHAASNVKHLSCYRESQYYGLASCRQCS